MSSLRAVALLAFLACIPLLVLAEDKPRPAEPWFVDDEKLFQDFAEKSEALATAGKCLDSDQIKKKIATDFTCKLEPTKPGEKRLDPEDVYESALPSVFLIGSVMKEKNDKGEEVFADGRLGTAWVLSADGVLVTNWHLFDEITTKEFFTVMDHKQSVYPVTEILAVNKVADIAVFRVAAKGLKPLPLAEKAPRVGAWVGVLGHPGDRYFTFTQGTVTRYAEGKVDNQTEKWMAITADYAYGSSGSPVLDRTGAVVGMAALTENLDYPVEMPVEEKKDAKSNRRSRNEKPKPEKPKPEKPKEEKPAAAGSLLQMVIKLTVPTSEIRKLTSK